MTLWQAALLGLVQGLTEFLPVSSSGHLELLHQLFDTRDGGLAFNVALHWGTLFAVAVYFRRDWVAMARGVLLWLRERRANAEATLAAKLVVGSVPAAIAGVAFQDLIETALRSPWVIVTMLAGVGVLLWGMDRRALSGPMERLPGWPATLLIGAAQAIALVPGTSRSGITMIAGLAVGLPRASAARFSFLLGGPIILGAGILKLDDVAGGPLMPLLVGVATAAISGTLAIALLLRFLARRSFVPFAIYRIALAALVAGILVAR